mmetsp:Transcript_47922/g.77778  ORF Transcript_47922/g.77778 Transcript_47922/m.77778 type:complete len:740 (-) Transcript_47922:48-2267(-)
MQVDMPAAARKRNATPAPQPSSRTKVSGLPLMETGRDNAQSNKDLPSDLGIGRVQEPERAEETAEQKRSAKVAVTPDWPQRGIMTLALFLCAVLLILGPAGYCWLQQGRADLADSYRGVAHVVTDSSSCHTCKQEASGAGHHRPALYMGKEYVNEVAFGGINGLLMMVTTVLGGIGADIPGRDIFALGTASLAAYGFSMGFGAFVVESAKEEFAMSQLLEEYEEVKRMPQAEVDEMICHYRSRGISEEDARSVAGVLSRYEDFWVHHMMAEELGIQSPRGTEAAMKSGLATGVSFLVFGMVPMLGLTVSLAFRRVLGPTWYRPQFSTFVSLGLSAIALLVLGVFISRVVGSRAPIINGMMMLANGCAASLLAFVLSQTISSKMCGSGKESMPEAGVARVAEMVAASTAGHSPSSRPGHFGSRSQSPVQMAKIDAEAWPDFRLRFVYALCGLWVGVCSIIVGRQIVVRMATVDRMALDSLRVFGYGWLTCVTTGLGAVPFLFVDARSVSESALAVANAVAAGMMLAASGGMLLEAHEHCGPKDWQIFAGLLAGGLFIRASELLHSSGEDEEEGVAVLHSVIAERRHSRKAMLIFTVMFCHSAAEGIAVGVAFSRQLSSQFGVYIALLLAVHNVPEGLAVALVLVPRGVSATLATLIAMLTSVPQPLLALAAFLFVEVFQSLLPLGLAFAAGAMVYVCLHELLAESVEQLGWVRASMASVVSFATMTVCIRALQSLTSEVA